MSVALASYAFNRPDRVAAPTRERILHTAAALGYRGPDATARALRLGRPASLGLVGSDGIAALLADGAAVEVARGLGRAGDRLGVDLVIGSAAGGPAVYFRAVPSEDTADTVLVDPPDGAPGTAVTAHAAVGTAAAARLIDGLGHTRLAVVAWPGCGARLAGVRTGWGPDRPLQVIMAPGPGRRDGDPSGRAVLALDPVPTAVIALSDPLAFEVLDAAANAGLDVPNDISVIGVDDLPGSAALGLTSVNVPYRPMGEQAANILWARIIGDSVPGAAALPTELIVRSTTGPPPDGRRH